MKILHVLSSIFCLPAICLAGTIKICDIEMSNTYTVSRGWLQVVDESINYRIFASGKLEINSETIPLSGPQQMQLTELSELFRQLFQSVLERELASSQQVMYGQIVNRLAGNTDEAVDVEAVDALIAETLGNLYEIVNPEEDVNVYSPREKDRLLEEVQQRFAVKLSAILDKGYHDPQQTETEELLDRVSEEMSALGGQIETLTASMCGLAEDTSGQLEQVKRAIPPLNEMELVVLKEIEY